MKTAARLLISLYLGVASAHVHLPLTRAEAGPSRIAKRDTTQMSLHAADFVYLTNISVGTPPQPMQVRLSQTYAETWVMDATSSSCDPNYYSSYYDESTNFTGFCRWGYFNQTTSSTYADANPRYASFRPYGPDGTGVSLVNFTDHLTIGDMKLENFPMGMASSSSSDYVGVLGLGRNHSYYASSSSSSSYSSSSSSKYYSYLHFLDRLVASGDINSPAYSIWLDDAQGTSGNLLLGAIDTSKYEGTLTRLVSTTASSTSYSSYYTAGDSYTFTVDITSMNGTDKSSNPMSAVTGNDFPLSVALDTSMAYSLLPNSMASKIWSMAGATYNSTLDVATIPCSADTGASFTFQLAGDDGPVLSVDLKDLILSPNTQAVSYYYLDMHAFAADTCVFGVQNRSTSYSSYYALGSSALRRSYLVFDTENLQVGIAPVKFAATNSAASNIVSFAAKGDVIPSSTAYCGSGDDEACAATCTSNCVSGTSPSSDSYTGSRYNSSSSGGLTPGEQAAIGVGVSFGVIALIAVAIAIVLCRRTAAARKQMQSKEQDAESTASLPQPEMTGARGSTPLPAIPEHQSESLAPQLPPLPPRSPGLSAQGSSSPREPSPVSEAPRAAAADVPSPKGKEPEVIPEPPAERPPSPPTQPEAAGKGKEPEVHAS